MGLFLAWSHSASFPSIKSWPKTTILTTAVVTTAIFGWNMRLSSACRSFSSSSKECRDIPEVVKGNNLTNIKNESGYSSTNNNNNNDDLDNIDCPMCQAMLAGPCASQFRTWYKCSKQFDGNDHVERCKIPFQDLFVCLEENDK